MAITEDNLLITIGTRLTEARKTAGLSRKTATQKLNISEQTLCSYELGRRELNTEVGLRMTEVYNITFERLTNYKNI